MERLMRGPATTAGRHEKREDFYRSYRAEVNYYGSTVRFDGLGHVARRDVKV